MTTLDQRQKYYLAGVDHFYGVNFDLLDLEEWNQLILPSVIPKLTIADLIIGLDIVYPDWRDKFKGESPLPLPYHPSCAPLKITKKSIWYPLLNQEKKKLKSEYRYLKNYRKVRRDSSGEKYELSIQSPTLEKLQNNITRQISNSQQTIDGTLQRIKDSIKSDIQQSIAQPNHVAVPPIINGPRGDIIFQKMSILIQSLNLFIQTKNNTAIHRVLGHLEQIIEQYFKDTNISEDVAESIIELNNYLQNQEARLRTAVQAEIAHHGDQQAIHIIEEALNKAYFDGEFKKLNDSISNLLTQQTQLRTDLLQSKDNSALLLEATNLRGEIQLLNDQKNYLEYQRKIFEDHLKQIKNTYDSFQESHQEKLEKEIQEKSEKIMHIIEEQADVEMEQSILKMEAPINEKIVDINFHSTRRIETFKKQNIITIRFPDQIEEFNFGFAARAVSTFFFSLKRNIVNVLNNVFNDVLERHSNEKVEAPILIDGKEELGEMTLKYLIEDTKDKLEPLLLVKEMEFYQKTSLLYRIFHISIRENEKLHYISSWEDIFLRAISATCASPIDDDNSIRVILFSDEPQFTLRLELLRNDIDSRVRDQEEHQNNFKILINTQDYEKNANRFLASELNYTQLYPTIRKQIAGRLFQYMQVSFVKINNSIDDFIEDLTLFSINISNHFIQKAFIDAESFRISLQQWVKFHNRNNYPIEVDLHADYYPKCSDMRSLISMKNSNTFLKEIRDLMTQKNNEIETLHQIVDEERKKSKPKPNKDPKNWEYGQRIKERRQAMLDEAKYIQSIYDDDFDRKPSIPKKGKNPKSANRIPYEERRKIAEEAVEKIVDDVPIETENFSNEKLSLFPNNAYESLWIEPESAQWMYSDKLIIPEIHTTIYSEALPTDPEKTVEDDSLIKEVLMNGSQIISPETNTNEKTIPYFNSTSIDQTQNISHDIDTNQKTIEYHNNEKLEDKKKKKFKSFKTKTEIIFGKKLSGVEKIKKSQKKVVDLENQVRKILNQITKNESAKDIVNYRIMTDTSDTKIPKININDDLEKNFNQKIVEINEQLEKTNQAIQSTSKKFFDDDDISHIAEQIKALTDSYQTIGERNLTNAILKEIILYNLKQAEKLDQLKVIDDVTAKRKNIYNILGDYATHAREWIDQFKDLAIEISKTNMDVNNSMINAAILGGYVPVDTVGNYFRVKKRKFELLSGPASMNERKTKLRRTAHEAGVKVAFEKLEKSLQ